MAIENYSFENIKTILMAFNLPDKPYATAAQSPCDIYFRVVSSASKINFLQDTFEYLREVLLRRATPKIDRRVAFLFENSWGKFAIVAHFQGLNFALGAKFIKQYNWANETPSVSDMFDISEWEKFQHLYKTVNLHCLVPPNGEHYLEPFLLRLPYKEKQVVFHHCYETIRDPQHCGIGVTLTESILMLLFRGQLEPVWVAPVFETHKQRCIVKLTTWFLTMEQVEFDKYQKIIELLGILIKYSLLQEKRLVLENLLPHEQLLSTDSGWKKNYFEMMLGDFPTVLAHLSFQNTMLLLRSHGNVDQLITELTSKQLTQQQAILLWEEQHRLNWRQWIVRNTRALPNYLWQRNPTCAFKIFSGFIMTEFTDNLAAHPKITTVIEYLLWIILRVIALLVSCLPQHLRPIIQNVEQLSVQERNAHIGSGMGLVMGFIFAYYGGMFELIFSYSLIFLTEVFHSRLSREHIDTSSACVYPSKNYIPSLSNLLRLNMIFLLTILALYTNDSYYFKRGLSAIGLSEAARRLFIFLSRDDDLLPEIKNSFEFVFSLAGSLLGTALYGAYHTVQARSYARENAIAKFTQLAKDIDPSIQYVRGDALSFSLNPISLLNNNNPLQLIWGNSVETYQTTCEIIGDFNGQTGNVVCQTPQKIAFDAETIDILI